MPHDRSGRELEVGDIVVMVFRVRELVPRAEICNATFESIEPDSHGIRNVVSCNASWSVKVAGGPKSFVGVD